MAELQKDPITRKDFLGFGVLGTIVGAILTIPPAAFVLEPVIKTDVLGETDVPDEWFEVGSITEVPEEEPVVFEVDFPVNQIYGDREIQEESGLSETEFVVDSAIWVSWYHEILEDGEYGQSYRPAFLDDYDGGTLTQAQIEEIQPNLKVLSSSCAHLGCPVRWITKEGEGEFLCPCHGGIYNINGQYVGGPPPRGMYEYTYEVREDGKIYVKHEFDIEDRLDPQRPYVI